MTDSAPPNKLQADAGTGSQSDGDATATAPVTVARQQKSGAGIALACVAVVGLMVGASFAAVPLYRMFCQVTGFGGTPIIGQQASSTVVDHSVSVRFDANVAPGVTWSFTPDVPAVNVKLGETKTVFYTITNTGDKPATGVATFNVQPDLAGQFFVKIQCFCFEEQTLQPGETIHAPVVFYVDPDLLKQPETRDLSSITLSYTVFRSKNGSPVAATAATADKNNL